MENLQVIAANMIYSCETGEEFDDPYDALDRIASLPADFYPRAAFFRIVEIPVSVQTYKYLLGYLDATPPKIYHFERLIENAVEPHLLERMKAGDVVGYRPVWHDEFWALEQIV